MGKYGKWIAGGLGWAIGGPIGALIGVAIGSLFDDTSVRTENKSINYNQTREGDFKASLLVIMACIMKADGRILKSELAIVKKFLIANFGEESALEALQILKGLLDQEIDEVAVARQINQQMNYSSKLELVHLLFSIAHADGELHPLELQVIERISAIFGISHLDFESIKAPFSKTIDRDWAYKTLEIEPTATNEEVKKAYRHMAMKNHPDKVHDLGEEMKKMATKKFQTISDAYETIKKERGMV